MPDSGRTRIFRSRGDWFAECLVCQCWVSTSNKTRRDAERNIGRHLQSDHGSDTPEAVDEQPPSARFVVRDAFTITRRGTCICGYPESGVVHTGDELTWFDGTADRRSTCRGIELIHQVPMQDPPTIGVVVTDALPKDFHEGMVILAFRASA